MKLAYIIMCHKNSRQVSDLIEQVRSPDIDVFIHIDKKAIDFSLPKYDNVYILPDEQRINIQWGTITVIEATLNTIRYMISSNKRYDYVFLISGQDYPIKSNKEINDYLHRNKGANYIEILNHSDKIYERYRKRNEIVYCNWILRSSMIAKIIKKIYICITGGYDYSFSILKRKNNTGLRFEFGSQWWCLTYDCVQWISNYIDSNRETLAFFSCAAVPDESLFQSIFMISPYRETQRDKLTYLEWEANSNHPRVFTKKDMSLLQRSECLFARKFDETIDEEIITLIKNDNNQEQTF